MNCEACQLKELVLEQLEIREVLRCIQVFRRSEKHFIVHLLKLVDSLASILHTIVFHRALGLVRPKDIDCELFEITYVQCGDMKIEKKIEEKIDQFIAWVEKHPNRKSQVSLSFYETKSKQPTWFSKPERLYWEQWYINLHVVTPKKTRGKSYHSKGTVDPGETALEESSSRRASLESSLREVLFQIIKFVNEKKDHLPSIPTSEVMLSPYEITIPSMSDSSFGWNTTDVLKRMLQTGPPTMLS